MTKDVIALTPKMPDINTLLAGLFAGGPDLGVNSLAEGAVVQLCAPNGRPLVSVEAPQFIQVPGEAQRLLGAEVTTPNGPYWWTEARASTAVEEGERLAGSFAGRLAAVLGGTVWPSEAAHTDVVPLTSDDVTANPAPATASPAVDVLTDKAAVVIQDRPVVAMTSWLADALRASTADDRALQIVTPAHTRLTLPTRTALQGHPNRWVVQDPSCGYYDGLSGTELHWQEGHFTPVRSKEGSPRLAEAFKPAPAASAPSGERQLLLSFQTTHPADEHLQLGGALEAAWKTLTGTSPAGWSTAEPIALPWSPRQLTELARARAQKNAPTWLTTVGTPDRPALATTRVTHTSAGIEEHITLALGYATDENPPVDVIAPLAETLATTHGLTSMLATLRTARRDLTVPPRFEAPPIPLSFTLGAEAVNEIGLARAQRPPEGLRPSRLGPTARPALHYTLGDGTDPTSWTVLQQLTQHLKASPESAKSPR
ncbi:hypothetical protein GCM10010277_61020 [Streptomyces longisporoflavus]|uniref:DUF6177 family protein n=1 Tax=Streptomyces longisporoflavus TaxID=28044 RepID=UPI00167E6541|nr:DUF6177 family protein [Streptomyces longisporoflavus]GGV58389.1 hypothetical protein GCM10010277_61020 [Streptomyces longisporoflavus]